MAPVGFFCGTKVVSRIFYIAVPFNGSEEMIPDVRQLKKKSYCRTGNFCDTEISRIRDFCEFSDLNIGNFWIEKVTSCQPVFKWSKSDHY